jgi:hypothetical protein
MENQPRRPWLSLYRGVRPELKPACETALDMVRATLARNGSAPLIHYFESSLSAAECDSMSDALAVPGSAHERRPRRRLFAERPAGSSSRLRSEVRRRRAATWRCDASSAKILRSPATAMICHEDPYADVGRAALLMTAAHTITTSPSSFESALRRCWPECGAIATRMPEICSRSSRGTPGSGRAPSS